MPRYFFHHIDGVVQRDTSGTELPDIDAARTEAVITLGHAMKDHPESLRNGGKTRIEVTDESGAVVAAISVSAT